MIIYILNFYAKVKNNHIGYSSEMLQSYYKPYKVLT